MLIALDYLPEDGYENSAVMRRFMDNSLQEIKFANSKRPSDNQNSNNANKANKKGKGNKDPVLPGDDVVVTPLLNQKKPVHLFCIFHAFEILGCKNLAGKTMACTKKNCTNSHKIVWKNHTKAKVIEVGSKLNEGLKTIYNDAINALPDTSFKV
jgi:hypothetical protein